MEESSELASSALRGTLEVFPDAGHFPTIEQPDRFNEVLLAFLAEVEAEPRLDPTGPEAAGNR